MTTSLADPAMGSNEARDAFDRDVTVTRSYALAALQGAMLVNHLQGPRSGIDIVQTTCTLPERVDVAAMRAAWAEVSTRHDVLRTSFRWEDVSEPKQDVHASTPPDVVALDWSSFSETEVAAELKAFLAADRTKGFDLRTAPLQRVTLMRVRDDYWHMVWTFHHILMDGRSFPMVLREVFAVYEALLRGETVDVMPRRPFSDFVDWYTAQDFSKNEAFWRERLRGIPGATPLPAAFHEIGNQSHEGRGLQARMLSQSATSALNKLARDNRLTMNNVVQGAWSLLLSRHSGESEIVFGATRACRKETIEAADDIIGLFINTVPVRVTVRNDMPLVQWLDELRDGWRALFEAEHTPVRLIQRWSEAGTQTSLFDSQVVFENLPIDVTLQADGGAMAKRGFHLYGHTNFALTALVFGGEELSLELENDRSLVDDATAVRLLDHLASIFESMAENPSATVGELTMLPARERALVVDSWNNTATSYPANATLVSLIGEQVKRAPDAIAVVDERRSLTYAELDRAASVLAHKLRAHGVGAGVLVGVCAERSVEMVIALVAAIKAGGAYVPIDPEYPQDRVAFMLEDAGAPVLLAQSHIVESLPAHSATVLLLDDVASAATRADAVAPLPLPSPDDSAYMIYTSGSTGRPKGARNAHRGIVNRLLWMQDTYNLTSRDVVLQKTPFSFDVSVWEFFWPLLTGAKLVMARAGGHKDAGYLSEIMQQQGVTICHFVPSMLRAFIADARSAACTTLRDVMASGEALPADLVAAFNKALPAAQLHNLYGPTECAVDVTYWPCPKDIAPTAAVPIGRPVANTQVYVLDEKLRPAAVGVPGELYLAGVQVGQGYHKRAELTAERFVPDTFAEAGANARMYRTGDRARWRPDGTVEYLGRLDFQVKIRGFRIELGEIENALLAHDAVRDAVVVAYSDPSADGADSKKLVAYVVGEGGSQSTATVRAALLERLPDYMVPAIFVWLPALPLSSNGKIDRRALPAPEVERNSLSRAFVAPNTREEVLLANIWKQTLKVADVGVEDNFFELGGDSLLGVQILARAASAGLRITLTQLLRTPTVAALARAAAAEALVNGEALQSRVVELRHEVLGVLPLTPVQRWFFENQGDHPHHWNQSFMFSVSGDVNVTALSTAIDSVVARHDSFRLRFSRVGESWTQRLQPSNGGTDFAFVSHDLRAFADATTRITALATQAQASLSVETGPLLRADLFKLGNTDRSRLLITVHHLAIDGVSWRIVREDIEQAYQQAVAGQVVSFESTGTPFSTWAHEVARPALVQQFERDLAYWEKVGAASTKRIPREAAGSDNSARHTETVALRLSADETRDLFQRVPQAYNTQINDVLISALSDALSQWVGDGELVVNVEGHGREDIIPGADISRTTGWFTTIFPVRLKLQRSSVASRLKETKELLRAVPNRGLSYGALRYAGNSLTPLQQTSPEIVFNYLGQFDQTVQGSELFAFASEDTGSWYGANSRRPHSLELNALVMDGCLELRWSYSTASHQSATIASVGEKYLASLRELIAHCTQPGVRGFTPSDFPLASIDQATLDTLATRFPLVENIYPLTPMQDLFLGVSGQSDDSGFEQWRYRVTGPLDVAALRDAWNLTVQRHAILRTAFVNEGLSRPLQVVSSQVELPFAEIDLRSLIGAEQNAALHKLLHDDRAAGFVVDRPPLMRLTLVRLADKEYEFVWSNHHLLLDRWSWPLILQEVEVAYVALVGGVSPALPNATSYAEFIEWQQQQPEATAREFWTRHFGAFEAPMRLAMINPTAQTDHDAEVVANLTADAFAGVQLFARSRQVATNAVIEAAWALCLARRSNHNDVSFGVAVAGRDANIAGIERMVGLTINNLPLRVKLNESASVSGWLKSVHDAQSEQQQFAHVSLTSIQQWSNIPWRTRLFETLLVFQHDDAEQRTSAWLGQGLTTELQHVVTRTAYPLSIMVAGTNQLEFRVTYDARYFSEPDAQLLANALRDATIALATQTDSTVGVVLASLPILSNGSTTEAESRAAAVAPRTATESVLARIWSEVLGAENLGVHDDFFRLGGYSLVATQIASRIRSTLKADAPVRLLFQHPTVATLASALAARDKKPGQLERIAQVVQRVQSMSLDEVRRASEARVVTN